MCSTKYRDTNFTRFSANSLQRLACTRMLGISIVIAVFSIGSPPVSAKIPVTVLLSKAGRQVTLRVNTVSRAACIVEAPDLELATLSFPEQISDSHGTAAWTFKVPNGIKASKIRIAIVVKKAEEQKILSMAVPVK